MDPTLTQLVYAILEASAAKEMPQKGNAALRQRVAMLDTGQTAKCDSCPPSSLPEELRAPVS